MEEAQGNSAMEVSSIGGGPTKFEGSFGSYQFKVTEAETGVEISVVLSRTEPPEPSDEADPLPKYACQGCGATEVRGDPDTYPVYEAEGDKLLFRRTETTDFVSSALFCTDCGEEIPGVDLEDPTIE